jgi:hypothetical protein
MKVFLWTQSSSNSEVMRSWECFYEPSWVHKTLMTVSLHYSKMTGFIKYSDDRIVSLLEDDWVHKTISWPHRFTITQSSSNSETMRSWECFYEPSHLLIVTRCGHESVLWTQSSSNSETMRPWECFYEPSLLLDRIVSLLEDDWVHKTLWWPHRFTVRRWLVS